MRANPPTGAMETVKSVVDYLPSVKNISFSSIQDAVQSSIVTVKNEFTVFEDPQELKPSDFIGGEQLDLAKK